MGQQRNRIRIEESRQELDHLDGLIRAWLTARREADAMWQYRTQLAAIEAVMGAAVAAVREQIDGIPCDAPEGEVYERCRDSDGRVLFVRRFWAYFRDKWDQRKDPELAKLLAAAEEVVWSCYAGAFRRLGEPVGPAPLPYVDPQFSPHAFPRTRPPLEVKTTDDLLRDTLARLPVPVTGLPPVCVRRPWWLVLLAHETGHHVEFDLAGGALLETVRERVVAAAARGSGGEEPDRGWAAWSHELFADAFALASVGPAYLWCLEEIELATEARMVADAGAYPPRAARRAFCTQVLTALGDGAAGGPALPAGDGRDAARARAVAAAAPAVAHDLVAKCLHGDATLPDLAGWGADKLVSDVAHFKGQLLGPGKPVPDRELPAARIAAAAAVAAWADVAADDERREPRRAELSERVVKLIADSREEGRRAAPDPTPDGIGRLAEQVGAGLRQVAVEAV